MKSIKCPICGKTTLKDEGDICDVCGWFRDLVQEKYPDETDCMNAMSLNEAKKAYKNGKEIM